MKKIVILGRPGSGKSTLAIILGRKLGIPVYHTDYFGWKSGWRRTPFATYRGIIEQIVGEECWIIEGNSPRTCDLRFKNADLIVFLNLPLWKCLVRMVVRTLRFYGRERPGSASGCADRFTRRQFERFLAFDRVVAPRLREALLINEATAKMVVLKNAREVELFAANSVVAVAES